ncbi:MAG: DNA alkylation repair protein [Bacteroidales bacterium]|nr:DNA alkylation repair protein [Bacteroidales bacterium]
MMDNKTVCELIINDLKSQSNEANLAGMKRFGIDTENAFGVKIPVLRNIAKRHKNNHDLALLLWETSYHEARLLASFIADPNKASPELIDAWISGFKSWDLCDQCCGYFLQTQWAYEIIDWYAQDERTFYKRTAFSMIARLAVHDKKREHEEFLKFLPIIEAASTDDRNMVKKAVNWALRQIGKRNSILLPATLELAEKLKKSDNKTAHWIGLDAYRELNSVCKNRI